MKKDSFSSSHHKDWFMPCDLFKLNFNLNDNLSITSHLQCIQAPADQCLLFSSYIRTEEAKMYSSHDSQKDRIFWVIF